MEAALPRSRARPPNDLSLPALQSHRLGTVIHPDPLAQLRMSPHPEGLCLRLGESKTETYGKPGTWSLPSESPEFIWGYSSHLHMKTSLEYLWGGSVSCVNKPCLLSIGRDSLSWLGPCKLSRMVAHQLNWLLDACVWFRYCFVLFLFSLSQLLNLVVIYIK